ncbi:hypothetical protein [Pseudomonas typographi]|uniref:Uncharacterized protein n=1 Tax=Pseudomonas typographi TaxID=2715964 RepID=A0ABR7Z774_9PSED|nr:hypothetical protein [Pseudomonas typographi]MBD1551163.1 hypothetical protein [Pseudomonas typographi]MBD1586343.1 hypothetical protein [Pseudomonas typographi]MBD1601302.1 hypothetical protein [Pseudomonas typographi]
MQRLDLADDKQERERTDQANTTGGDQRDNERPGIEGKHQTGKAGTADIGDIGLSDAELDTVYAKMREIGAEIEFCT